MAYQIAGHRLEIHRAPSAEDLRRAFETAVCRIYQADLAAKKKPGYRVPIVQRGTISEISQACAEKRALSDAAQSLALLWKI
jgi:hypothetical protein